MRTISATGGTARMSNTLVHGEYVFLSGQVPAVTTADIRAQTRSVLREIDSLQEQAGATRAGMLSAAIYLTSLDHFEAMNAVCDRWVAPLPTAETAVEALLGNPDHLIAITCISAPPDSATEVAER